MRDRATRSKPKDFEQRNEKCLVASWRRYIIDSFTFHRIFATLFLNNDGVDFLPFLLDYLLHGQRVFTWPVAISHTNWFPLSENPVLFPALCPRSSYHYFLIFPLFSSLVQISYRVLLRIQFSRLKIDQLGSWRWREVSKIIGSGKILYCKWSIWDIAEVGVKTIFSIFAFTFINPL